MGIDKKYYQIEMFNGEKWKVPISQIALNRARYYSKKDGIALAESLSNDTLPLFESNFYEVEYWAKNNMIWPDVAPFAVRVEPDNDFDYEDSWCNGDAYLVV